MKIKVIDKGNGKETIKEISPKEFIERIRGAYVYPKTAQEEFWAGKTKQIQNSYYIYQLVKKV